MFFRFFIYARKDDDAIKIFDDCLKDIKVYITTKSNFKIEPYWKFNNMYVVEMSLKLEIEKDKFIAFMDSISDNWLRFGNDELLASENIDGYSENIKNKISMVNAFLEDEELYLIRKHP